MLIRPTTAGAQVPATAHGLLAAAVSLILGVAAHSFGGGHLPTAVQATTLTALALCVGLVRAAQLRAVERSRARGQVRISATGVVACLTVGQAGAHAALALMDGHDAHGSAVVPGPTMLAWHLLAIPAAAAVLFAAERLHRVWGLAVARVWHIVTAPVDESPAAEVPVVDRSRTALRPRLMTAAAGVRGPPVPA